MFLYVVDGDGDLRKIGRAVQPARRLGALRSGSARDLKICHTREVEPDEGPLVERFAHWILRDRRVQGEWFRVSAGDAKRAIEEAVEAVRRGERPGTVIGNVGRKKLFPVRITLPLTAEMVARLDATLDKDAGEDRVSSIREAIELHLKRRERQRTKP